MRHVLDRLRLALVLATIASLVVMAAAPIGADDVVQLDVDGGPSAADIGASADAPVAWFVELVNAPTADGTSFSTTQADKSAFRRNARQAGLTYTERFAYDTLFNGLSISLPLSEVSALRRISGVKAIWPVYTESIPDTYVTGPLEDPDLFSALSMTGADVAQNTLGLTGAGIKVAVMDTGIDYNNPDLGGCTAIGGTCRVITGWDFVGDDYNAAGDADQQIPHPDADPDDCAGHGTHVAGIIGANGDLATGGVRGVAPGVSFGAYRVFGCEGSTTADIMLAAMERLLADGMQVLNMSIGSSFQWPQYPTARASDRLVNRGVTVVASIGNSGANGLYSAGAPGVGSKVIGVASFDNIKITQPAFSATPDGQLFGYNPAAGAPTAPTSGSLPLTRTGTTTTLNDACTALPAGSLAGQAVLIRRGTCTFYVKASNARNAGAAAVILYNNTAGELSPTVAGTPAITIPVVAINAADGATLNTRIAAGPVTISWTPLTVQKTNPTGNLISSFSSYGLSPDLELKPDLGAPGGSIYSTYPLELGGHASLSGTSMSSPHVAGAVALLLQARPRTSPQAVRDILQNSADPHVWWVNPASGLLDNVQRQGAGMLDIPGAILSTTAVAPAKLALGESQAGPATRTLTVTNTSSNAVTYDLSHAGALSTGANTFAPTFATGYAAVTFSVPSVSVPAGGTATFDVTITANSGLAEHSLYGGYIVLTPQGGGATYRVPYAGFKGDYQSITVLTNASFGLPSIGRDALAGNFTPVAGGTFTLTGTDLPYVMVHLDHQARRLRVDLVDTAGKDWHHVSDDEYVGRNSVATATANTGFFAIPFDGTTTAGNRSYTVPNGSYKFVVTVLKALGDAANPADWETWTSPAFTIARP